MEKLSQENAERIAVLCVETADKVEQIKRELRDMARAGSDAIRSEKECFEAIYCNNLSRDLRIMAMRLDRGAIDNYLRLREENQ